MKKSDREIVFNKFGGKCAYCGCELTKGWHVDHLESVGRYKKYLKDENGDRIWCDIKRDYKIKQVLTNPENDHINNYMPACASCNIAKSSMSLESFRKVIYGFLNSLNLYHNQYKFAKRYGLVEETNKPVIFYFESI